MRASRPATPQRASDQAYAWLLERILDLRIPPGSVVNEQQLALEIGLGRMPVREALARLAGDRFTTVMARRSTVVTSLGLEDVLDMFEAREALQCGVAHLAARKASDDDLATLGAFDFIINATSAGRGQETMELPFAIAAGRTLAVDLSYGEAAIGFLAWARSANCAQAIDGLGMLVEQAAASFELWHGQRPDTQPVYQQLRAHDVVLSTGD